MDYDIDIERIIDKNFNKVNNEGVGFLSTEMEKCKTDLKELVKKLTIPVVSNWVAIEDNHQPERGKEVMVEYIDGWKEVAFFDGDYKFYKQNKDEDITDKVAKWHKLP